MQELTHMTFASMPVRGSHRSSREESGETRDQALVHKSVMVGEVVKLLDLHAGDVVVDATYGKGGHSAALKKAAKIKLIALDADPAAGPHTNSSVRAGEGVVEANFGDLEKVLKKLGVKKIDKVLFDLGWNMTQLESGRGFSFMRDEPLNMSYGKKPASGFTAAEILNTWSEKTLADVFFGYGEERYARRIARAVSEHRKVQPFETTIQLVETIRDAVPPAYRHGRLNPATKTFQALRIAVNDELGMLSKGLHAAWKMLSPQGRIAVISFHSIEDRLVKKTFAALVKSDGNLVVKKPLTPTRVEVTHNPAARSAKLRAIEKNSQKL